MNESKPVKPFKLWVQRIWIENTEEHLTYGELPYTIQEYWTRYKWWLRREYRHQCKRNLDQANKKEQSIWHHQNPQQ